jgi:hypothetical protein
MRELILSFETNSRNAFAMLSPVWRNAKAKKKICVFTVTC